MLLCHSLSFSDDVRLIQDDRRQLIWLLYICNMRRVRKCAFRWHKLYISNHFSMQFILILKNDLITTHLIQFNKMLVLYRKTDHPDLASVIAVVVKILFYYNNNNPIKLMIVLLSNGENSHQSFKLFRLSVIVI